MHRDAIVFGSIGMGEVVEITPLLRSLDNPTLVLRSCHRFIFDQLFKVITYPSDIRSRRIDLDRQFADSIGLDNRPCLAPFMREGVFIDNEPSRTFIPADLRVPVQNKSVSERVLSLYGIPGKSSILEVNMLSPQTEGVVTLCSSASILRSLPYGLIKGVVERVSGLTINVVTASPMVKKRIYPSRLQKGETSSIFVFPTG